LVCIGGRLALFVSVVFPALIVQLGASPSRASDASSLIRSLASADCAEGEISLAYYRLKERNSYLQEFYRHVFRAVKSESGIEIWTAEFMSHPNLQPATQWFGDIACALGGEASILLVSHAHPYFTGMLWRVPTSPREAGGPESSSRGGQKKPVSSAEIKLQFKGSVGAINGQITGTSVIALGSRALVHLEVDIGGSYSGRLFLTDPTIGKVKEVKLQRGKTRRQRRPGQPAYFSKSWVNVPLPWDAIRPADSGKSQVEKEEKDHWFACSDLRDCAAALDRCGHFMGVRKEELSVFESWIERLDAMGCPLGSLESPDCQPSLACVQGRCQIQYETEKMQAECSP